ncbi:hypothetical protein [Paenarthrobacter nitroguajacolicus]|uniref:hypothetical protein n=1 Tax=Paenarthrobacter nitroguajacolicus TaxID=211146 RepID=UPI00248B3883|nr:hypothetical protein [Paenarthrobacter nitroguajacolicus]MDI2035817.1 hypothetical protein [Paenarthrobacter nitroguajacolicus]
MTRRLLYRSGFWEIARPRHPLTAGHVVIRLSDPSTDFALPSAADWLYCHNLARTALSKVLGAERCALMFAHQWHPLGAGLGEPVAESSTPTFHLFGRWEGESTTPGLQLSLPAHRRAALPESELEATDQAIRDALRRGRPEAVLASEPAAEAAVEPSFDPARLVRTIPAGARHTVMELVRGVSSVRDVLPSELLAIAASLGALPFSRGVSGFSCIALESGSPGSPLRIHALGRSAAEDVNPLVDLIRSPEVSLALL